jgi:hypothetical protein
VQEDGSRLKIAVRNNTKPGAAPAPNKAVAAAAAAAAAKQIPGGDMEL